MAYGCVRPSLLHTGSLPPWHEYTVRALSQVQTVFHIRRMSFLNPGNATTEPAYYRVWLLSQLFYIVSPYRLSSWQQNYRLSHHSGTGCEKSERISNGSCGDSVRAPMAPQNTTKISAQHVSPVIFQSSLPTICHIVNAATLTVSRPVHAQYPMETQTESRCFFSHGKAGFSGDGYGCRRWCTAGSLRGRRQRIR